jgi:putative PIN family toxin of toxin-antitoxin system
VSAKPGTTRQPRAVVDTNVWLDLFLFCDPASQPLARALAGSGWVAARCAQTDAELEAVLQRPRFSSSPGVSPQLRAQLAQWRARALFFELGPQAPWICRDRDDQKFLDLAFAAGAALLLTKDKALLALNRKACRDGLSILTPNQFAGRFPEYRTAQGERIIERMMAP